MRVGYVVTAITGLALAAAMFPSERDRLLAQCEPARLDRDCLGFPRGTVYGTECRPLIGAAGVTSQVYPDVPGKEKLAAAAECADPAPANALQLREQHKEAL